LIDAASPILHGGINCYLLFVTFTRKMIKFEIRSQHVAEVRSIQSGHENSEFGASSSTTVTRQFTRGVQRE
jgi:hypothetical protein